MSYVPTVKEYLGVLAHIDQVRRTARRSAPEAFDPYELGEPPRIEDWRVEDFPEFECEVLVGRVIGHPHLGDRPEVVTSALVWIDDAVGWARTLYRFYRLGAPRHDA